jgi:hypothetical protein
MILIHLHLLKKDHQLKEIRLYHYLLIKHIFKKLMNFLKVVKVLKKVF